MKQIILGTAGHIDHGKTALIKAVTGVNTDRLKEEQLRGITIELGFADMTLPSGQHLGIVDVPGHEKFVKNMVAGASGIDIVAMIIAADEGVMPQTKEHMEICTLLGIEHGMVVLTKVDLVDEEWLELVIDDIQEFTAGTFLEDKPVIPVSSLTGEGIPEFREELDRLCREIPSRTSSGLFRLPVDRVFTMKGFGTVITGTMISGRISSGETIQLYPSGITSKVRGIQAHNRSMDTAGAGLRTAINFQGLEKAAVNRGDVVARAETLKPSYMVDVSFHYTRSNSKPIKSRTRIRFHTGTSEILGNLILLDREEMAPGESTVVQMRLDAPLSVVKDDRFVIRSYSPIRTIGGGRILNPIPQKHKRFRKDIIAGLEQLKDYTPEEVVAFQAQQAGYSGVSFGDLQLMSNLPEKQLMSILQNQLSKRRLIQADKENRIYLHYQQFETLLTTATDALAAYHQKYPLKPAMPKEELKSKFPPDLGAKLFNVMLNQLMKDNRIAAEENAVRLAGHRVMLQMDQAEVKQKIASAYRETKLQPPYFKELSKTLEIDADRAKDVLLLLIDEGQIVKVKEDLYFHAQAITELKARLVAFLKQNDEITTPQFKTMTAASRKFVIPLIEYFDATNVTIRIGDTRKLRGQ